MTFTDEHIKLLDTNLPLHAKECIVRAMENCMVIGDISNYRNVLINMETDSNYMAMYVVLDELNSDRQKYDDFWRCVIENRERPTRAYIVTISA